MNNFLKSMSQIEVATSYLQKNGLIESGISAKNWEISEVIPHLRDGNLIDLGSDGSVVLPNAAKLGLRGQKVGIDLTYTENKSEYGIDLIKGDLVDVPFPNGFFQTITSLSVIEHDVNISKFAKECSRLLSEGGRLYVSFDFWEPKPSYEKTKLYSLDWNILNRNDVDSLLYQMGENEMAITGSIDWTLGDAVINDAYCSPVKSVAYTFGILSFQKVVL